eukprot:12422861-Karenia_brevis.AAC.1
MYTDAVAHGNPFYAPTGAPSNEGANDPPHDQPEPFGPLPEANPEPSSEDDDDEDDYDAEVQHLLATQYDFI